MNAGVYPSKVSTVDIVVDEMRDGDRSWVDER